MGSGHAGVPMGCVCGYDKPPPPIKLKPVIKPTDWLDPQGQYWGWCQLCDAPFVRCQRCGNNCCNGGTGELEDGSQCGCADAYDHQEKCRKNGTEPTEEQIHGGRWAAFWNRARYEISKSLTRIWELE